MDDPHRYDDMLDMPHHVSPTRPHMSLGDRAAQFAPFAALTGFGAAITEADRLTDSRIELGEVEMAELSQRLRILEAQQNEQPEISVTWFKPDQSKPGGHYETTQGRLKRVFPEEYLLRFTDGRAVSLEDVIVIEGEIFGDFIRE